MEHSAALMMAISLFQMPAQARLLRKNPLPEGVVSLLEIVANQEKTITRAVEVSGHPREVVQEASAFFIEQLLLHPEADSYRILGARAEASSEELRRNMALLLRWLHPDMDGQTGRSLFAHRVTRAWNDLKTQERRDAYDHAQLLQRSKQSPTSRKARPRTNNASQRRKPSPSTSMPVKRQPKPYPRRMGLWHRVLLLVFGKTIR